jgi:hypothetical protein
MDSEADGTADARATQTDMAKMAHSKCTQVPKAGQAVVIVAFIVVFIVVFIVFIVFIVFTARTSAGGSSAATLVITSRHG